MEHVGQPPRDASRGVVYDGWLRRLARAVDNVIAQRYALPLQRQPGPDPLDSQNGVVILVSASDAPQPVFLPSAAILRGRCYIIKKIDSTANAVSVKPIGGELIDDAAVLAITTQYVVCRIISDGKNWWTI